MNKIIQLCFVTLLLFHAGICLAESNALSVKITIKGYEAGKGQIIASVFNSEESFLKEALVSQTVLVGHDISLDVIFDNLPRDTYAIAVIYDEDKNGKLNTGFLGIPSELVGVSNNAKGLFGPPSFEDSSFELQTSKALFIQLGSTVD